MAETLSTDQLARHWGLGDQAIRRKVSRGEIPYQRDPQGRLRFDLVQIEATLCSSGNASRGPLAISKKEL